MLITFGEMLGRIEELPAVLLLGFLLCNSSVSQMLSLKTKHDQCLHCVESSYSQVRFIFVSCVPGDSVFTLSFRQWGNKF